MRKRLSIFILSFIIIIVLASCKNEYSINDEYKTILKNINENTFDNLGYSISYNQNYEIESHSEDEYEKMDYTISYDNIGELIMAFEGEEETFNSIFDYDKGYIYSIQKENYVYNYKDLDKISNEVTEEKTSSITNNSFSLKYDDNDFYVSSKIEYLNDIDENDNYNSSFCGKIAIDLLNEAKEAEAMDRIASEIMMMDGHFINEFIQSCTEIIFIDAKDYNDEELINFIKEYDININEKDNEIIIDFKFDSVDIINDLFDIDIKTSSKIIGKLIIDKSLNKLKSFEYDLKDYYCDLLNYVDDDNIMNVTVNKYLINGSAFETLIADINLEGEFLEYTDSALFIEDVENNIMLEIE